jgi:fibronectin type 3 domain-containing protein
MARQLPVVSETLEPRLMLTYATFQHPGILNTASDFTRMATEVAAGAQPWLADWQDLQASGYAKLGQTPNPQVDVDRGGTLNNFATLWEDEDRAYDFALEWKLTGNTAYANLAVTYLNAWSSTNTELTGDSDRFLASGLYGFQWANIAEIMRTYSGWSASSITQFQNYLLNVFYPLNTSFLTNHNGAVITNYWANWDLCNLASEMAIGVFCDRHDIYSTALNYIYDGGGNGAFDKAIYYIQPGNLGQGQEEGRDQGHSNLDFAMLGEICQMAWNQGDDLFSYHDNEILAGLEYLAKYNLGNNVPFTTYAWESGDSGPWEEQTAISNGSQGQLRPIFELFYDHYVVMEGLSAPYTTEALMNVTRPEGDNGNGDEYSWGTLTFALPPSSTVMPPQDLVAYEKGTGNIQLDWWGGANDTSFNIYRATSASGPWTQIASGRSVDSTTYTDTNLTSGTYYYEVTGVSGSTETAASNVAMATGGTLLVGELTFNQSSGTTVTDATGNGMNGTLIGGASFTAGRNGSNALLLNGSTGYVSLPAGAIDDLSDFTIAAWVNISSSQTWARVFDFGDGRGDWMFLTIKNGSGLPQFSDSTTYGNNEESVTGSSALPTKQWVHLAVTFSNRLATLYVNGIAVGSNANMDFPPYEINGGMPNSWIGHSQYSTDPYFNGEIQDFRVYRGAMPAGQVYTLATGSVAPAVPAAPASLTATAVPGNQINLSWPSVSGATSYSIYRSSTSVGSYASIATLLTRTTYSDTGLSADVTNGTPYYYVVTAADAGGEGAASPQGSAIALPPSPLVPTTLVARGMSATSVSLNWVAGANDVTYTIYRATTSGGPYTLVASGVTTTSYTDTGRTTGATYYYVVNGDNAAGASANSAAASAVPNDLFVHLKFDDGSGTTAVDSSGNGWNGTLVNSPTWTTAGKVDASLTLNSASSQYVSLPSGVVAGQTSFTIAAWVFLTTSSTWMRVFDFGTGTSNYMFLTVRNGSNVPRFAFLVNGNSTEQGINGTSAIPTGVWTHMAVTWSNNVGTLYVNGVQVGQNTSMTWNPSLLETTTQNYIGRSEWSSDPYFNGTIDDFRIYAHALTAAQIYSLATTAVPPAPTAPAATAASTTQINLTWSAGAGATGYNVYRGTTTGGPYALVGTNVSTTSFSDTGLIYGTTYYYVVTSLNAGGESGNSTEVNATTVALPSWLSPASVASWSPSSRTLTITGAASIIADPGTDEPVIQASGSVSVITLDPTSGTDIHIGGLSLTNGASAIETSLGAARSITNYHLLVIGTAGATAAPLYTIDSTSTLDLADNDMAILYGSGASPLTTVEGQLQQAYDGGPWNDPGLTTSAARAEGGKTALGFGEASTLGLATFDGLTLGGNAVLVKYTVVGDTNLDGSVGLVDYNTLLANYNGNGQPWTSGSVDYSGNVGLADYNTILANYNQTLADFLPSASSPAITTSLTTTTASSSAAISISTASTAKTPVKTTPTKPAHPKPVATWR